MLTIHISIPAVQRARMCTCYPSLKRQCTASTVHGNALTCHSIMMASGRQVVNVGLKTGTHKCETIMGIEHCVSHHYWSRASKWPLCAFHGYRQHLHPPVSPFQGPSRWGHSDWFTHCSMPIIVSLLWVPMFKPLLNTHMLHLVWHLRSLLSWFPGHTSWGNWHQDTEVMFYKLLSGN